MKQAIILMTKIPLAGTVKTRLHPILPPEECAALAAAFLQDAFLKAQSVCGNTMIALYPFYESDKLKNILHAAPLLIEQIGEDLGERMFNAFQFAFENDSDAVVLIGTDSPTFPPEFIAKAFEYLEKTDAVLGKTADGGFYLIGLRRLKKEIFENVEWSSAQTFEQTLRNITRLNFNLQEIPAWYDVDEPEDLHKLFVEFQTIKRAREIAPKTFRFLTKQKIFPESNE